MRKFKMTLILAILAFVAGNLLVASSSFAHLTFGVCKVYHYNATLAKVPAAGCDHTYIMVKPYGDSTYSSFSRTGGQSGGTYLSYTSGQGRWNNEASYRAFQASYDNYYCGYIYGLGGVCHQETNRELWWFHRPDASSLKVPHVQGADCYSVTRSLWSYYGGQWDLCRYWIKNWHGISQTSGEATYF